MLCVPAKQLGFNVVVLDPTPGCPAAQVGAQQIVGDLYDKKALKKLAAVSDFITVEIEHLDSSALEAITALGKSVNPAPKIINLIQDKLCQKQFLQKAGLPVAEFIAINSTSDAAKALRRFKKMHIKARHGAYDGRGNILVKNSTELGHALKKFSTRQLYVEKHVPFKKELAVIVARDFSGKTKSYPTVETIHKRNICQGALAPARISKLQNQKTQAIAKRAVKLLDGVGVFAIEMFLARGGEVLINEIAPRVHNCGHFSLDACHTSQFEQHIRAISGLPLGKPEMKVKAAAMVNILGERNGATRLRGVSHALAISGVSVYVYGKSPTKVDRKMGHITATADTLQLALSRARAARRKVSI